MSFATAAASVREYFNTRWSAVGDGTAVVYENVSYDPTIGTAYLIFGVRPVESAWVAPGWVDSTGAVVVAVMSPSNAGPEAAETTAALVAQALSRQKDSGIQYYEGSVEPIGQDGQGFYQCNVRVPFTYEAVAT